MVKFIAKKLGILPEVRRRVTTPKNLPYYLLRIESFFVFLTILLAYFVLLDYSHFRLGLFVILLVAPDLTLFAYAFGQKVGATIYDIGHTYTIPVILLIGAVFLQIPIVIDIILIWLAHIAQDRMRGYGFKYTDRFEGSHLHSVR